LDLEVIGVKASVGDSVIIRGKSVGNTDRHGVITEVKGPNGEPPWTIRYEDGHEALCFPGPDCVVEHKAQPAES
jgi:hypothetical protein